nr:MAG TPA: hypothetical protein [Caudoviricetes sp.]
MWRGSFTSTDGNPRSTRRKSAERASWNPCSGWTSASPTTRRRCSADCWTFQRAACTSLTSCTNGD